PDQLRVSILLYPWFGVCLCSVIQHKESPSQLTKSTPPQPADFHGFSMLPTETKQNDTALTFVRRCHGDWVQSIWRQREDHTWTRYFAQIRD
ncbi:MAG: hypothetical protein AAF483_30830, partial [Planctomycetota bacterium]